MDKIEALREKTYSEAMSLLKKHKRAVIVRPTGFGKTGILTKMCSRYKKVLYLYPADVIMDAVLLFYYGAPEKIPIDASIPNVVFKSYMSLAVLAESDDEKRDEFLHELDGTDLIICDECHRIGAEGASAGLDIILKYLPDVHMVGATATPERMDTIDEIARYFDDRTVSEYNLHDAFKDGILKRPYYYYFNYYDSAQDIGCLSKEAGIEIQKVEGGEARQYLEKKLSAAVIQASNLIRLPGIIRKVCHDYAPDENYMRFITFFSTFDSVRTNGEKIKGWFKEAYPDHEIRVTLVTSEDDQTRMNARRLKNLKRQDKTIDLIFSCNMMNMGYHVNDLTGIVMYRRTYSGIIYTQQLGRVLSSDKDARPGIVLDLMDNIHTESMYQLLGHESDNLVWRRKRLRALKHKKLMHEACVYAVSEKPDKDTLIEEFTGLTIEDADRITEYIGGDDVDVDRDFSWNEADEREMKNIGRTIKDDGEKKKHRRRHRDIEPEDLIAVSNEAAYRDLIIKTVAEAKSMRCRQAWARWLEEGGRARAENGRPLSRSEVLAQLAPDEIPLPPFCRAKMVSVDAVLNEMGVPDDGTTVGIHETQTAPEPAIA